MSWSALSTDEKISAIRDIYPQTAGSANAIAAGLSLHLKEEVSRNAVIGIFTRHADKLKGVRLSGHAARPKTPKAPKPPRVVAAPVVRPKKVNLAPVPVAPKKPPVDVLKPKPFMTKLVDLACDECVWPENDGGPYLFCGHLKHDGSSYCRYHHLVSIGPGAKSERMAVKVAA